MPHADLEVDSLLSASQAEDAEGDLEAGGDAWYAQDESLEADQWSPLDNEGLDDNELDDAGNSTEYPEQLEDPLYVDSERQPDAEEEALAYELMTVGNDADMEEFLGKLLRKAGRGLKKVGQRAVPRLLPLLKGPAGQLLKRSLPLLGSSLGSVVPGAGTVLGGMAGQKLGQLLGGEMENAGDDEAKLDLARRLVKTVTGAASDVAQNPSALAEPVAAVRDSLVGAMRSNLPAGVRQALHGTPGGSGANSGRWIRRGRQIILLGA